MERKINMKKREIPLFEFDSCQTAFINPSNDFADQQIPILDAKVGVICFFKDAIDKYLEENECKEIMIVKTESNKIPVYLDVKKNVILLQGCVGAPLAACEVEALNYLGVKKIITCGGAGVLNDIALGHLMIPISAIRDEGTSYHYSEASYEIVPDLDLTNQVKVLLSEKQLPYIEGKTWTTDAPYRETKEKVNLRRSQGCICVEMECSAFFAVGQFRNVAITSVLFSGDSLHSEEWDNRSWNKQTDIRYKLLQNIMDIAFEISVM